MRNHLAIYSYIRIASIIVHAEDLPVPVRVRARGDQAVHVDHPAALADLLRQGAGPRERLRPAVEAAIPGALCQLIELGRPSR